MHQQRADFLCFFRQYAGCDGIDCVRQFRFGFGLVHRRVSGRIDDDGWALFAHDPANRIGLAQIELRPGERNDLAQGCQRALQFPAELAVDAGEQDAAQAKTSASLSNFPA